jgi:hypothetical protein
LAAALTGRAAAGSALRQLLNVGHTSGAALAWGLVLAAQSSAILAQPATPAQPPPHAPEPVPRKAPTTSHSRRRSVAVCPIVGAIGPISRHSSARLDLESGKSAPPWLGRVPTAGRA